MRMAALSAPDPICHKRAIDSSLRTRRPARDDMTALVWPEIYFIRHSETPWNAERRYQGRRDIPLNEKGKGQASLNGRTLARLFASRGLDPTQFEWHASPLGRTRETMERVRMGFDARGLQAMELVDHFGSTTRLRFSNLQRNPKIDPAEFRFEPPPGVDVLGEK